MTKCKPDALLACERARINRDLIDLSESVLAFLHQMNYAMDTSNGGADLELIVKLCRFLDTENDRIRFSSLGIDHAKDDKEREYRRLVKKHRNTPA